MPEEVEVLEQPTETPRPNLDFLDRTTGTIKKEANAAEKPIEIKEPPKEVKPIETPKPAETAPAIEKKEEKPTDKLPIPNPAETAEKKETPEKFDLKKVLEGVDRKEALSILGLDEFDIGFVDFRKNGGDATKYVEVKGRDWGKVSDYDVLRYDLRQQYPDLDAKTFDMLAEARINDRFPPEDEFTDQKKKELSLLELKLEADKLRKKYGEEDKKFSIPERKPDTEAADRLAKAQKEKEDFVQFVDESEITKKLLADKKITGGDGTLQFDTDPEKILSYIKTDNKFFTLFKNEDGQLDLDLLYSTVNYALNRKQYEKSLFDLGKGQGVKAESDEIHNIPKEVTPTPGEKKESLHEAFQKRGRDIV